VATGTAIPALGGRYRVLGAVGRGAIAEVVRARDERTGAEVALKILYPHLRESAAVVERFRREVDIVRRVRHPHVLAIHDVVESGAQLYLVMDYHPGGDLADRLARERALPPAEIAALARQLCGALAAAHRAGIVHRDVKPSNVLCGPGPELDVRLCDFGLARTADFSGLTTANAVLGTPEYMAPEVITEGHADPRSDIYSLGVVLFEAATGRLPFYGDSPYQLMRQHVDAEAPRARTPAPELPAAIDDAIARALAKDPLDRFATADDLARAIEEVAAAPAPALAVAQPPPIVARRTCRACGGWLVEAAAVCADCGAATLRLERDRHGVSVLVVGPGAPGDKVGARQHVALYDLLDEATPASRSSRRRRRRAPRVPFYVAKGLTRQSADALVERLQAIGFQARVETRWALAPREVRSKLGRQHIRYLAGFGGINLVIQSVNFMPHSWGRAVLACLGGLFVSTLALVTIRSGGSLVAIPRNRERRDHTSRLTAALAKLETRQDRRLVARVLERLGQLHVSRQDDAVRALATHAAEAAEGLNLLDAHRTAAASLPSDPQTALRDVRRDEMAGVVLRATLLRAASLLDTLVLALSRVETAASRSEIAALEGQIRELAFDIDAQSELAGLLAGQP